MQRRKPPVTRIVPSAASKGQAAVTAATERNRGLFPASNAHATVAGSVDKAAPPFPETINLAVMLINFSDDLRQPWTTDYISALYNTGDPVNGLSVTGFYNEASWGQMTVTADVFGWWTIDLAIANGCNVLGAATRANAIAATNGITLADYDRTVYLWPYTSRCNWQGFSDGPVSGHTWINLDPVGCPGTQGHSCTHWHVLPHELGHSLGLDHSGKRICTDNGANVVLSNTCTFSELMDQFCGMGCCTPSLFSNAKRLQIGWTPLSKIVTIAESGTYTIAPAKLQDSSVHRLADGTGQYLYFENRGLPEPPVWSAPIWPNGNLLIRRAPEITNQGGPNQPMTELLDGSPADNDLYPNVKGLPVGDGFTLPNTPATVTNQAWDGTNNLLAVTFN